MIKLDLQRKKPKKSSVHHSFHGDGVNGSVGICFRSSASLSKQGKQKKNLDLL